MLFMNVSMVQAGKFRKAVELLESAITWPERALVAKIEQEGSGVFKLTGNIDDFRPRKGGIKVCKAENKLFIGFYLSQKNIDFYKGQVYEDGERKPVGLEIDVTDDNKVFNFADLQSVTIVSAGGNSFDADFYLDNPICDLKTVHTIGIANPGNLTPNQWYYAEFQFSKHNEVSQARFQLQVQLVGDVWNLRSDYYDDFSASVKTGLYAWFGSAGYENIPANNFFNIVSPRLIFNRDKFFGWPEGLDTGYDRFLWDMVKGQIGDYKPYHCGFGSDPWDNSGDDDGSGNSNGGGNGNNSGNGNNGGSGYTDDSGTSNPWAGYADDVGLKYMKIGKKSSGHWSGSKTWTVGEIPNKRDFRIKLKQKGGVWPDEACAEVWFSANEHFTGEDLFLGRKCKDKLL